MALSICWSMSFASPIRRIVLDDALTPENCRGRISLCCAPSDLGWFHGKYIASASAEEWPHNDTKTKIQGGAARREKHHNPCGQDPDPLTRIRHMIMVAYN